MESYLAERSRAKDDPSNPCVEFSLRAFLQCGIPRFGVARFRCECGESRFVPFSCKRRMACPSCDAKRAVVDSTRALEEVLPDVAYRQWVLVLPKRLRYFVHRDARLAGEIDRVFARTLTVWCRWSGVEFVRRVAALVPPARKHQVRYFGSLGPRSPMRGAMRAAAKAGASAAELEAGYSVAIAGKIAREAARAAKKAGAAWAACVRKVFEVDPILCVKCGGEMKLVAVILDDRELERGRTPPIRRATVSSSRSCSSG